jgi:hypothetical protein
MHALVDEVLRHPRTSSDSTRASCRCGQTMTVAETEYGIGQINADDVWTVKGVQGEGRRGHDGHRTDWTHPCPAKYRDGTVASDHSYSARLILHTTVPTSTRATTHVTGRWGRFYWQSGRRRADGEVTCRNMDPGNGPGPHRVMEWGLRRIPRGDRSPPVVPIRGRHHEQLLDLSERGATRSRWRRDSPGPPPAR